MQTKAMCFGVCKLKGRSHSPTNQRAQYLRLSPGTHLDLSSMAFQTVHTSAQVGSPQGIQPALKHLSAAPGVSQMLPVQSLGLHVEKARSGGFDEGGCSCCF